MANAACGSPALKPSPKVLPGKARASPIAAPTIASAQHTSFKGVSSGVPLADDEGRDAGASVPLAAGQQWWSKSAQRTAQAPPADAPAPRALLKDGWTDLGQGCSVGWWPDLLAGSHQTMLDALLQEVDLQEYPIRMFGKTYPQRRLVGYCGAPGLPYTYSGVTLQPQSGGPVLAALQRRVEGLVGEAFNSCLLNLYRSGDDQMGWHADNEKVYDCCPTIVSVSLGARRGFVLRRNALHADQVKLSLGHGDVMAMRGRTQLGWQHKVPETAKAVGQRLSLTFRRIVHPGARGVHREGAVAAPTPAAGAAASPRKRSRAA